jgi:hypothetical protein
VDPNGQRVKHLTQEGLAHQVSLELGTIDSPTFQTISNWEKNLSRIDKDDRNTLVALIKVLNGFAGEKGLKTAIQANQVLEEGGYRPLRKEEQFKIFGDEKWSQTLEPLGGGDSLLSQPLPAAELEVPTGVVPVHSPFYVVRAADGQLRTQILGRGSTTTIRAGRQFGKTSLLIRGIQTARQRSYQVIDLDFQLLEDQQLRSLDTLLKYLGNEIAFKLDLDPEGLERAWKSPRSTALKFNQFLRSQVLSQMDVPFLLAIDEADRLLDTPYKQEFFALVRSWDSLRAYDELWQKLNLVIVISTHPSMLIDDVNQSPFNVGLTIHLNDFTFEQVADLNTRYGSPLAASEIPKLMECVGGHPYLVRQALYVMVSHHLSLEALLQKAPQNDGPFGAHLRFYRNSLKKQSELLLAFKQIIQQSKCPDEMLLDRLVAAGLAKESGDDCVSRCGLYTAYFGARSW